MHLPSIRYILCLNKNSLMHLNHSNLLSRFIRWSWSNFKLQFSVHFNKRGERDDRGSCVQLGWAAFGVIHLFPLTSTDLVVPSINPAIYFFLRPSIHLKSFTSETLTAWNFPSQCWLLCKDFSCCSEANKSIQFNQEVIQSTYSFLSSQCF